MNKKFFNALLLGVVVFNGLSAAEFTLHQPEDYSTWQITCAYAKPKPKEMNGVPLPGFEPWGVKSATLMLTKPLWHEEDADTQSGKIKYWFDGHVTFYKTSDDPLARLTTGNAEPQPVMGGKGFPRFGMAESASCPLILTLSLIRRLNPLRHVAVLGINLVDEFELLQRGVGFS
jgi:hypothetical protein